MSLGFRAFAAWGGAKHRFSWSIGGVSGHRFSDAVRRAQEDGASAPGPRVHAPTGASMRRLSRSTLVFDFAFGSGSHLYSPYSGLWEKWKSRRCCGISKRSGKSRCWIFHSVAFSIAHLLLHFAWLRRFFSRSVEQQFGIFIPGFYPHSDELDLGSVHYGTRLR